MTKTTSARPERAVHYERVKVQHEMIERLAQPSAPVTFRIEREPDGDLMLICSSLEPLRTTEEDVIRLDAVLKDYEEGKGCLDLILALAALRRCKEMGL